MLRGGALGGSYQVPQRGSLSESPLSPTTSSSQARTMPGTMPFLVTTRCADSSSQLSSGTSAGSPFTFNIPGDGFISPAMDIKQQPENRQQVPPQFFPSPRQEALLEDPALSSTPAEEAAQQMLIRGSSFQSAGGDTKNTHSSSTSGGSSQLSNGRRDGSDVQDKEFSYNQLHSATSIVDEDRNTDSSAEQSNDPADEEWDRNQKASVMVAEHSLVEEDGKKEKIGPEAGSHKSGSTNDQQHQAPYISGRLTKEEHTKFNQQQLTAEQDNIVDSAAESMPAYVVENSVAQSHVSEIFPPYSLNLMSSDSYNFPTGVELLGVTPPMQHSSRGHASPHASSGSIPNGVTDESLGPFGNAVALYPNQNLVRRLRYTTSPSLKGTWTTMASPYANTSLLDGNHVHSNLQAMSSMVGTPESTLLSDSLQGNPYSQEEPSSRDDTSYFSSQQTQTVEAMQSCLSPTFGGPNSASRSSVVTPGNLALMSHSAVDQLNGSHNQQHFLSIPVPAAALTQSSLSQPSQLLGHEGISSSVSGQNIVGNQGYNNWRNGGNELLFLPGSDSTVHTQPFPGRMGDQLQGAELGISQYGSRRSQSLSEVDQLHQHSIFQNGDGRGSPSSGIGNCQLQGLSLSLSSQQPSALQLQLPNHGRSHETDIDVFAVMSQASAEAKGKRVECTEGRYNNGILSRFRPQREDQNLASQRLQQGYGQSGEGQHSMLINSRAISSSNTIYGSNASKYLKLCQVLLGEICVVRKCERRTINHEHFTPQRASWSADQPSSASVSNSFTSFHASRDAETTRKDFLINLAALSGSSSSLMAETSRAREPQLQTHIQSDSREDLEKKKVRLGSYLEEVDRRYRVYFAHMMDIIAQFNSLSGPEAATPYTALALQAMSRHFRCLRDAVSSQLRSVKRALGEQDNSPSYGGRELSSLGFVDQQLRQQRTLQQLGVLQQHAWRPQRGLPERAVSVLRSWLFEHFLHPYPKDSDKLFLAKQTGLTRSQVSNWFINARVRLWKPMVEEMYLEEFSNSDEGGSGERKTSRERRENEALMDYDDGTIATSFSNGQANTGRESQQQQQQRTTIPCGGDGVYNPHSNIINRSTHGSTQNGSTSSSLEYDADQRGDRMQKKARNGIHNHPDHLGSPIVSMDIDADSPGPFNDPCRLDGAYGNSPDEDYNQHQDILATANGGRFGAYLGGHLTGYPGGSFVSRATTSTNGGVSLTLGLRHSDGLSLPVDATSEQTYGNPGHLDAQRLKNHLDSSAQDGVARNMDDVHSEVPLSRLNPDQEDLKQRDRLTSHMLHEFVVQG